ncbi:hypothetical protein KNU96_gp44 [Xanthomonas phage FoX5]|uniref:Uncharacterized protein n=1 Tax=Xanthomonas phage FoX5 TaxID=2723901 RepID=A0A858NQU1_9CAUD|nr:hypothetical protein KNU96_gp44 [Xanthomonas phage FoX5]QJB22046.1 hypothetical protein XccvBFoX5_gp68 [Xanthomonas phage FoX5]
MARTSEYGAHQQFKTQISEVKLANLQAVIDHQDSRIKELIADAKSSHRDTLALGFMVGMLVACIAVALLKVFSQC